MDKDNRVTCTDCINWDFLNKNQEKYFGCQILCPKCPCNSCSCYDSTSTRRFETRPMFIKKN